MLCISEKIHILDVLSLAMIMVLTPPSSLVLICVHKQKHFVNYVCMKQLKMQLKVLGNYGLYFPWSE